MKRFPITIKPFGNSAVLIEWPPEVDGAILTEILDFVDAFKALGLPHWEMSVAYNSLTMVHGGEGMDFADIRDMIIACHKGLVPTRKKREQHLWTLPVCYDADFGMDMGEVCHTLGLSREELIHLHTSHRYLVYGMGFLPGFMYLGGLPESLEIPRRAEPRPLVAKGSVGLAAKQTGIYPQESPGGWNIIGNCPVPLFDPKAERPTFVKVGDWVRFEPIARAEYELHKIEAEVGIYKPKKKLLDA